MADDISAAPAEGAAEQPSNEAIESQLAAFDFDDSTGPAGLEPKKKEPPRSAESTDAQPAGEEQVEESASEEDDPEINLRDNRKVKLSELKRNFHPEFQQHLDQFAQQREQFQKAVQGFSYGQQQTAGLLQHAVETLQARMPRAPDPSLIDSDPFEYNRLRAKWEVAQAELGQVAAARNAVIQQQHVQQAHARQQRMRQEADAAVRSLPDLRDPVKFAKFSEDMRNLAAKIGYRPHEVAGVTDHRILRLVNLALQGEKAMAALESAKAKMKAAAIPEVQTPQKRRSSAQVASESLRAKMDRLRKNPNSSKAAEDALSQWD